MKLEPIQIECKTAYKCSCCDKIFEDIPFCFGIDAPAAYDMIPPDEIEKRIELDISWCVIDDEYFFHRGRLIIPIIDYKEDLIFDVWTSINRENFFKRMDLWQDPDRVKEGPYFGWFNSYIVGYENTIDIKSMAIEQEVGCIPDIIITEENHSLRIDQQNGITYEKALGIVSQILHF